MAEKLAPRLDRLSVSSLDVPLDVSTASISPTPSRSGRRREKRAILVTGADSLVGQHFVKQLHLAVPPAFTHVHTFDAAKFFKRLEYAESLRTRSFAGDICDAGRLATALVGVTTVVHAWDRADLSLFPDEKRMEAENVQGTRVLLAEAAKAGVRNFIYISSIWTMTSTWPSVMNPEISELPPSSELPFPAYARTKLAAEALVFSYHAMNSMAVRLGPMYGEADRESALLSLLSATDAAGNVRVLGDQGGCLQYTYAGNVGWGLLAALRKLDSEQQGSVGGEVLFLTDATPIRPIYRLLQPLVEARGAQLDQDRAESFLWAYAWVRVVGVLGDWVLGRDRAARLLGADLPSPAFLYTHFYYWYFFSGAKARTWLNYIPRYSYDEALTASLPYYKNVQLPIASTTVAAGQSGKKLITEYSKN